MVLAFSANWPSSSATRSDAIRRSQRVASSDKISSTEKFLILANITEASMHPGALGLGNPSRDGSGWLTTDIVGRPVNAGVNACLLYTSDAADDLLCVDLGG